jgi:hypothetical protein
LFAVPSPLLLFPPPVAVHDISTMETARARSAPLSLDLVQDETLESAPDQPAAAPVPLALLSSFRFSLSLSRSLSYFRSHSFSLSLLPLIRRRRALFSASIEAALNILYPSSARSRFLSPREIANSETDVVVVFLTFCRLILSVFIEAGFWLLR